MKLILKTICIIFALFCCIFPFTYKNSVNDKSEVRVYHILVDTKEEADSIREQIVNNPEIFEEMAEKYSKCETCKKNGDLGYKYKGSLLKGIDKVVFNIEKDKISEPIESEYGWHLVKVTDIKYFSDKENFAKRF